MSAIKGDLGLQGIAPPPVATPMASISRLVCPLATLTECKLISIKRPLALPEIIPKFWPRSRRVSCRVPLTIRVEQIPNLGCRVLLKVIVPVVTIRLRGLFRALGNIVPLNPPFSLVLWARTNLL